MKRITALILGLLLILPAAGMAALTTVNGTSLTNILDAEYGAGNYTRIDDSIDAVWETNSLLPTVTITAKLLAEGGYNNELDLYRASGYTLGSLLYNDLITTKGYSVYGTNSVDLNYSGQIIFKNPVSYTDSLNVDVPLYDLYSYAALNPDTQDHMVSYRVNGTDTYILAWEDTATTTPSPDWDFDDFVVEITGVKPSPVPIPTTLLLFASGMLGLVGLKKKAL